MAKRGKRYKALLEKYDRNAEYSIKEAVKLIKELATAKFDETIELHMRMGIDPKKPDQNIRSSVVLPHGTGKNVRVLVFAEGAKAEEAKEAGADYVGSDDLIEKIQKGWLDFDIAIATPDQMRKVSKIARILGPRGLMPNPKAGTVTNDIAAAVKEFKAGKIEFRNDKTGNLHIPVGKASFDEQKLLENIKAALAAVLAAKPASSKGAYIKKMVLAPTMGPGVRVNVKDATDFATKKSV
ncbi:MAG: 50S ribosomal protein L1 [Dictyoglomi bacterium]|nr:50S ribosomal protein L1 [Dictyoglomota bacterium]